MLRYSNRTLLRNTRLLFYVNALNTENSSDVDRFNGALSPLLNNLTAEASTAGSLRKFATGNTTPGPGLTNIYALVQCTPDLTQLECSDCLQGATRQFLSRYNGPIGGRTLVPTCNFRYENTQFYNVSTLAIPPPTSPPSGERTSTSTTRTVIIVTVSVTV
nr:cysteine-rich RLK (receptor-like protein kinase) 26 [Tanacetum cinerariifolium]